MKKIEIQVQKPLSSEGLHNDIKNYTSEEYYTQRIKSKDEDIFLVFLPNADENFDETDIINAYNNHDYENYNETLASVEAKKIGYINFGRDIDVQIDQVEVFMPKEKQYNLKGEPTLKSYVKKEEEIETPICDLIYEKIKEEITDTETGIVKTEFVKAKTTFKFYTKEDKSKFKTKVVESLPFTLTRTPIKDAQGNIVDIIYSSVKREGVLRDERYKSEQMLKSFNPNLYNLMTNILGNEWNRYKETGDKTNLLNGLNNPPSVEVYPGVTFSDVLNSEVNEDDKIVLGIPIELSVSVLDLILESLQ